MAEQLQIINENAMAELGAQLANVLIPGVIIYLDGDLGAGKTPLVRGMLRSLGYSGAVKSPTFTVVEPYSLENNKFYNYNELEADINPEFDNVSLSDSTQVIYHFDLYRLEDPEELEYLGIRDYLDGRAIALIEWPQKGYGILPEADLMIKIIHQSQGRKVELLPYTENGTIMLSKIISARDVV